MQARGRPAAPSAGIRLGISVPNTLSCSHRFGSNVRPPKRVQGASCDIQSPIADVAARVSSRRLARISSSIFSCQLVISPQLAYLTPCHRAHLARQEWSRLGAPAGAGVRHPPAGPRPPPFAPPPPRRAPKQEEAPRRLAGRLFGSSSGGPAGPPGGQPHRRPVALPASRPPPP